MKLKVDFLNLLKEETTTLLNKFGRIGNLISRNRPPYAGMQPLVAAGTKSLQPTAPNNLKWHSYLWESAGC